MYLTQSELVEKLKVEGFTNAQPHIIRYGITRGSIDKPATRGGNFIYLGKHLNQVRSYLKNVPRPGRKSEKRKGDA